MEDDFDLTISLQAQSEIREIFQFYEMRRPGKGSEFAEDLYERPEVLFRSARCAASSRA